MILPISFLLLQLEDVGNWNENPSASKSPSFLYNFFACHTFQVVGLKADTTSVTLMVASIWTDTATVDAFRA